MFTFFFFFFQAEDGIRDADVTGVQTCALTIFRAAQGCANAFVTPLLLAGLAEITAARKLGQAVGTFAAVQTSAIALSPLVGGLAGAVDWRLAFFLPAAVTVALAFFPPQDTGRA